MEEIDVITLYDTGANIIMSVHSTTRHDLCPVRLMYCKMMISKLQFRQTSIVCQNLQKELIIGIDMQQLFSLHCDWTYNGHVFIHINAQTYLFIQLRLL